MVLLRINIYLWLPPGKASEQAPLVSESIRFDTAASVTTSTKSTSSSASPMDTLKKIFWKRDQYLSLLTDMIAGTDLDNQEGQAHVQDMRIKVDRGNEQVNFNSEILIQVVRSNCQGFNVWK
jgi:hypothetical protein